MDIKELIGVTLGTCTLERMIGRGGMGAVFLAQQARPVRTVAVKVLIPSNTYDAQEQRNFLERFRREADTVAKLEHKNILPIYEYDEAFIDNQHFAYLVMPYVRGGTLRERIEDMQREGKHFDLRVIVSYISQVADALNYAHSFGIVHRDVKPANLLFHLDGRLMLSDFGIVRLDAMPSLTAIGDFLGTVEYASPEQVSTSEIDPRSDIYSLGIILYELLTGEVPFMGSSPFAVMNQQLSDPVPPLHNLRPDLSPAIEAVVMKVLAKKPADRYQSALEFSSALRSAVSGGMPATAVRFVGDATNSDLTVAESAHIQQSALRAGASVVEPASRPSKPVDQTGGSGVSWRRPAQFQATAAPDQYREEELDEEDEPDARTFHEGRRIYYYAVTALGLLAQIPAFVLLYTMATTQDVALANLGILLGCGVNLMAVAAIGFTGITRTRSISTHLYRALAVTIVAPLLSSFFVNIGVGSPSLQPILAYLILLGSNFYSIRQLGLVDVARDEVEDAPILWGPISAGALTGLLPLTIILLFVLVSPVLHSTDSPPLLDMLKILLVALIGAPTPGAVLAVWRAESMSPASLVRCSAFAGLFVFLGAFMITALWGVLVSQRIWYFAHFSPPWLPLLLWAGILGLIGMLRGLLDSWIYLRMTGKLHW